MKKYIVLIVLLISSSAFASGSFECVSGDKTIVISGTDSSAGTLVRSLVVDGQEYSVGDGFQRSEMLNNNHQFAFKLMDADYNGTIIKVDTVKAYPLASGLIWDLKDAVDTVICEFDY